MSYQINPVLRGVTVPPIADAQQWIAGRTFLPERPLLDVSQAVPNYAPAAELQTHLAQQVLEPGTALYTPIAGLPALREALAASLRREYAGAITAEHVAITAGCNEAFAVAMMALASTGDEVLLPLPYYFNHQMWLQTLGLTPVYIPFNAAGGGQPSIADIAQRITPRTRALVLVTPNNPTGTEYTPDFLTQCFELCKAHGMALVLDETYKDLREDIDHPPHPLFARPDWQDVLVQLYSFSKVYALTGYRVGSLTAGPALEEQLTKLLDCITICPSHLGQLAALYGLQHLHAWQRDKRDELRHKRLAVQQLFATPLGGFRLVSSGAYFAYVEHPFEGQSATQVAQRLAAEHNLLMLPGSMFGPGQERYLRIAFANLDAAQLPALGERLSEAGTS